MIVQLKSTVPVPMGLSEEHRYRVIAVEYNCYRLLADDNDPVLYEITLFYVVSGDIPSDWHVVVYSDGEDGAICIEPKQFSRFLWEDFHDDVPYAVSEVKEYLARGGEWSWSCK